MNDIKQTVAENMRYFRKIRNLSQEKLAENCGLHRTYIGSIEQQRANVSMNNIQKIATALSIDPALLFITYPNAGNDRRNLREGRARATSGTAQTNDTQIPQQPARKTKSASIATPPIEKGNYALCSWTDDGLVIEPITVEDEAASIDILRSLIASGHDEDLAETYEKFLASLH